MVATRGTSNKNQSGSSYARRKRKQKPLDKFGDGEKCQCFHCDTILVFSTLTVDRIIPGVSGGTYEFENCRPSCMPCASAQGGEMVIAIKRSKSVKKGDVLQWMGCWLEATAVARDGSWANFRVTDRTTGLSWSKRIRLPLTLSPDVSLSKS